VELDTARRVEAVRRALDLLPPAHLATLGAVVQHLHQYGGPCGISRCARWPC